MTPVRGPSVDPSLIRCINSVARVHTLNYRVRVRVLASVSFARADDLCAVCVVVNILELR